MVSIILGFLGICLGLNNSLYAQAQHWQVNPDHSEIQFEVSYLKVSHITGRFTQFAGDIWLDPKQSTIEKAELMMDPSSIFTGNRIRDAHLKEQAFFHVAKYPNINFKMQRFTAKGDKQVEVEGILTIKEHTQPIKIQGRLSSELKDTWNYPNIFIWFETKLDRNKFGMGWNKSLEGNELLVGHEVSISGILQLQPMSDKTPTGKHRIPDNHYMRWAEKKMRGELSETEFKQAVAQANTQQANSTEAGQIAAEPVAVREVLKADKNDLEVPEAVQPMSHNIWFFYLCFLAFLATILIFYVMKKKLMEHLGDKYSETNVWGIASDVVGIVLTLSYAIAVYQLGK